jgi:hypothetical protein
MTRTQVKTPRIAEEEDLGNFPGWEYPKMNRGWKYPGVEEEIGCIFSKVGTPLRRK